VTSLVSIALRCLGSLGSSCVKGKGGRSVTPAAATVTDNGFRGRSFTEREARVGDGRGASFRVCVSRTAGGGSTGPGEGCLSLWRVSTRARAGGDRELVR
jgi:hypothetical protein